MSTDQFPAPESEYGYTLRQVEQIVGVGLMPAFREHMMMRAHVLDGPDGEVFYPFDVMQFVERARNRRATFPEHACALGYTATQLGAILGDRVDAYRAWAVGKTQGLCEGTDPCSTSHGHVDYPEDVSPCFSVTPRGARPLGVGVPSPSGRSSSATTSPSPTHLVQWDQLRPALAEHDGHDDEDQGDADQRNLRGRDEQRAPLLPICSSRADDGEDDRDQHQ